MTGAVAAALCVTARRRPGAWVNPVALGLAISLIVAEGAWILLLMIQRAWAPDVGLPLHLCDVATLLAAAALLTRRRTLVELTYFWACAGTLQALITPDVPQPYPSFVYFQYYLAHGLVVIAALFLVIGLRISPTRGAVIRSAVLTAGYAAVVGVVDAITGGDYLFLRHPPPTPSLLDLMGRWPWYLVASVALGTALFAGLNLPFWLSRRGVQATVKPSPSHTAGPRLRAGPGPSSPG